MTPEERKEILDLSMATAAVMNLTSLTSTISVALGQAAVGIEYATRAGKDAITLRLLHEDIKKDVEALLLKIQAKAAAL